MKQILDLFKKPYFAIIATLVLAILCFMPSENIPDVTSDKTAHFVSFAVLSFIWLLYSKKTLIAVLSCVAFGVFIEMVQYILPKNFHRGYEVKDMIADAAGVIIGLVLFLMVNPLIKKLS